GAALAGTAHASPCRDDGWQPTYVHDLINPAGNPYYVQSDGSFVEIQPPYESNGPAWCKRGGVRDRRGFGGCRNYTRVQCGCDNDSWGNRTCARFLAMRGHARDGGTGGASEVQRIEQREQRDASGKITVEGAIIHVIACQTGPGAGRQFY